MIEAVAPRRSLRSTAEETRDLVGMLERAFKERPALDAFSESLLDELRNEAPHVMETLWPALRSEADAQAVDAEQKLKARGTEEANALRKIIQGQRDAIEKALGGASSTSSSARAKAIGFKRGSRSKTANTWSAAAWSSSVSSNASLSSSSRSTK